MKKTVISLFFAALVLCTFTLSVFAVPDAPTVLETEDGYTVIYYEDGSTLTISPVHVIESTENARSQSVTKTTSKDATYADSKGNLEWKYTLYGTFSYVYGVSSTCDKASYSQTIYDNSWSFSDGSAARYGNTAHGKGHYDKKVLFITTESKDVDVKLTCDIYGNIK